MKKFVVYAGLPGSGKTTLARERVEKDPKNWVRVNNDDIRNMLWGQGTKSFNEDIVTSLRIALIHEAITRGKNIVVDNVNLDPKHQIAYKALADKYGYEFEFILVDTPVAECVRRDALRPHPVGAKVIYRFYEKYLKKPIEPLKQDASKPHVIMVDIDGTTALFPGKNPYDRDFSEDIPNPVVLDLIRDALTKGWSIIFCSGRDAKHYRVTTDWLENKCGLTEWQDYSILMRNFDDKREDSIVKRELFDQHIRGLYYVHYVLDDRQRVVDLWRSLGLTVLQVADGNF